MKRQGAVSVAEVVGFSVELDGPAAVLRDARELVAARGVTLSAAGGPVGAPRVSGRAFVLAQAAQGASGRAHGAADPGGADPLGDPVGRGHLLQRGEKSAVGHVALGGDETGANAELARLAVRGQGDGVGQGVLCLGQRGSGGGEMEADGDGGRCEPKVHALAV